MIEVGVHEAKSTLSELLRRVADGEEVVITRSGEPIAHLVPAPRRERQRFGTDRGLFEVADDFDAPLPDEVVRAFEGGS